MTQLARIFVSQCRQDMAWCRTFVEALRWGGLDVWYGEHSSGDARLSEEAERELRGRPIFVVVLSPSAVVSNEVKLQYFAALHLRTQRPERVILPVIAEPCELPPLLREFPLLSGAEKQALSPPDAAARVRQWLEGAAWPVPVDAVAPSPESDTADAAWERGKVLRAQGLLEEALDAYRRAVALDPMRALAWYGRGNLLYELKRYEEAVVAYDQVLALDGLLAYVWHDRGLALYALKRYEDAIVAFERALSLDQRSATAWDHRGDALWQVERHEDALASYDAAISLAQRSAPLWLKKGNALHSLARAQGRAPGTAPLGPHHISSFRQLRLYEEALAAYERALALAPGSTTVWNNKIRVLEKLGRLADAAEARRQRERTSHGN